MDEHPAHWNNTLMGGDFWKDATDYEEQLSKNLETCMLTAQLGIQYCFIFGVLLYTELTLVALDLNLHRRFPFNLISEQSPQTQDQPTQKETPAPKLQRRVSVSGVQGPGPKRRRSLTLVPSRFLELSRRARSRSPVKHSAPTTPVFPWSPSLTPLKAPDEYKETTVEAIEIPASPRLAPIIHRPVHKPEIATPKEPLMNFRGGCSWDSLPRDKETLGLDLFWPCRPNMDETNCLSVKEIKPLCQFRNLRSLKIVGMLQSYQTYIWQAVWLNMNLDELELGMALEPVVANPTYSMEWQRIQHGWKINPRDFASPVYL